FLEERDEKDIVRNAMVGVFLRLLEYHQGVLFLTTNRVKNIDQAFYSRISIGLRFGEATVEKRAKIWTNLTESANVPNLDIASLAKHNSRSDVHKISPCHGCARWRPSLAPASCLKIPEREI
ncbi:MAG: hypothetical protein K2X81_06880, partial [Candidatus Obscuribacterales bacterium]|nr:hypothetical protein [Candidatus Obscuribacterales bacterium]